MEINVSVYCGLEPAGFSQCGLLLDALENYRDEVHSGHIYDDTATALRLLSELTERVLRGTLTALEGLEPFQRSDGNGGYKTAYKPRTTTGEGRAE